MVDVLTARLGHLLEQRDSGHDLPRLAVAVLHDIELDPRFLYRLGHAGGQTLDGRDRASGHGRDRCRARTQRHAVDMNRACATLGDTAAVFRAGETELLADHPQEWRVRIAIELATRTVDIQR